MNETLVCKSDKSCTNNNLPTVVQRFTVVQSYEILMRVVSRATITLVLRRPPTRYPIKRATAMILIVETSCSSSGGSLQGRVRQHKTDSKTRVLRCVISIVVNKTGQAVCTDAPRSL